MASKSKFIVPAEVRLVDVGEVTCLTTPETCLEVRGSLLKLKRVEPLRASEEAPTLCWDNKPTVGFEVVGSKKSSVYLKLPGTGFAYLISTPDLIRLTKQGEISKLALQLILRKSGNEWVWVSDKELASDEVQAYRDQSGNKGIELIGALKEGDTIVDNSNIKPYKCYILEETETYYEVAYPVGIRKLYKTEGELSCIDRAEGASTLSEKALAFYKLVLRKNASRRNISTNTLILDMKGLVSEVLFTLNMLRALSTEDLSYLKGYTLPTLSYEANQGLSVESVGKLVEDTELKLKTNNAYLSEPNGPPFAYCYVSVPFIRTKAASISVDITLSVEEPLDAAVVAEYAQTHRRVNRIFSKGSMHFKKVDEAVLFFEDLLRKVDG